MLSQRRVLVAEDELIIASELATAVEEAGGEAVGPVASVREGLALLGRGVVVVVHSASPVPREITDHHGAVVVCPKPMAPHHVVRRLAVLVCS